MWDAGFSFSLDDLMPHVADYLSEAIHRSGLVTTARVWKMHESIEGLFGIGRRSQWTMEAGRQKIPFWLGESGKNRFAVQLILFRVGVGFLTFSVKPETPSLASWLDFLHYFRVTNGQREVSVHAQKKVEAG